MAVDTTPYAPLYRFPPPPWVPCRGDITLANPLLSHPPPPPSPCFTYKWRKEGEHGYYEDDIKNKQSADLGFYSCVSSNF